MLQSSRLAFVNFRKLSLMRAPLLQPWYHPESFLLTAFPLTHNDSEPR